MSRSPKFRPPVTHDSLQGREWVYYIRRDGYIKIGTTGHLATRMNALRPEAILALEPGGHKRETYRHRQFDRERIPPLPNGETEWFEPSGRLLRHIAELAERNPPPTLPVKLKDIIMESESEHPAEVTAPIPVVRISKRERLRHVFRVEEINRTFEGDDAWQPPNGEPRDIASLIKGDGRLLSNWWPFGVVVYAIAVAFIAQIVSFWIIPIALAGLMLFNHWCQVRIREHGRQRLQIDLEEEGT